MNENEELQGIGASSGLPPFDAAKYRAELSGLDITEEQATEFLRALDFILRSFVDLGWGVDSVQNIFPGLKEFNEAAASIELEQDCRAEDFNEAALPGKDHGHD